MWMLSWGLKTNLKCLSLQPRATGWFPSSCFCDHWILNKNVNSKTLQVQDLSRSWQVKALSPPLPSPLSPFFPPFLILSLPFFFSSFLPPLFFSFCFCFLKTVSSCSWGWPRICNSLALDSQVAGLQDHSHASLLCLVQIIFSSSESGKLRDHHVWNTWLGKLLASRMHIIWPCGLTSYNFRSLASVAHVRPSRKEWSSSPRTLHYVS